MIFYCPCLNSCLYLIILYFLIQLPIPIIIVYKSTRVIVYSTSKHVRLKLSWDIYIKNSIEFIVLEFILLCKHEKQASWKSQEIWSTHTPRCVCGCRGVCVRGVSTHTPRTSLRVSDTVIMLMYLHQIYKQFSNSTPYQWDSEAWNCSIPELHCYVGVMYYNKIFPSGRQSHRQWCQSTPSLPTTVFESIYDVRYGLHRRDQIIFSSENDITPLQTALVVVSGR